MRDLSIIQTNLDNARKRLNEANNDVEKAKALIDVLRYEHMLATAE